MPELHWIIITFGLFAQSIADKKYCWYFEAGYPIYFICKSYEDCCDTHCCVRALSIQKVWYFWLLLALGILLCCGAGLFLRRRMHAPPHHEQPELTVSFIRQPIMAQGLQQHSGIPGYGDSGRVVFPPPYPTQSHHTQMVYPPLHAYYSQPPPSYEQVLQESEKK